MIGYALELALETFPLFALAIVIGSLLDHYLPQSVYKFGEKKDLISVLIAALMGSLIPLCTCGMIPLAAKLKSRNVSDKTLIAFLISGNASSITALIMTASIGIDLALQRAFASIFFGVGVAFLFSYFYKQDLELKTELHTHDECCEEEHSMSLKQKIIDDLKIFSKEFIPWILAAIIIASISHEFLNFDISQFKGSWYLTFLTPLLAFPFYFCAGVDVPIIEEMLRLGFSGASVLSFMLAAPGTNLTSLIMYGKLFGIKAASYLIGISLLSAITIGFILGQ